MAMREKILTFFDKEGKEQYLPVFPGKIQEQKLVDLLNRFSD